ILIGKIWCFKRILLVELVGYGVQFAILVKDWVHQREVFPWRVGLKRSLELWFLGGVSCSINEESEEILNPTEKVIHFYRVPLIQENAIAELLKSVQKKKKESNQIVGLKTEQCFNIRLNSELSQQKLSVSRLERSRQYLLYLEPGRNALQSHLIDEFAAMVHDRMTECVYARKLTSFETSVVLEEVRFMPVLERGCAALEEINAEMGLAFDEQDSQYYARLFMDDIKRNPSTVELFDIAQSNSEHSRHWFFTGKLLLMGSP
ncbi:Phosphoribosylformylglycinamidine synthase, linker domain, partial [Dillenia turbinata]